MNSFLTRQGMNIYYKTKIKSLEMSFPKNCFLEFCHNFCSYNNHCVATVLFEIGFPIPNTYNSVLPQTFFKPVTHAIVIYF